MSQPMSSRTKLILVNSAVAVALVYKRWQGAPIAVILIVGIFMFALVNAIMYFATKKSSANTNS
jgi:hypothetical protein